MCGIFGYTGSKKASPILLEGLKRLEYRGYDSVGFAIQNKDKIKVVKDQGRVKKVGRLLKKENLSGTTGLGHSRWSTHGRPSYKNSHPHSDCSGKVHVVHNGIIENYQELKKVLQKKGHQFVSDTDSEVLPHLFEEYIKKENYSLEEAVRRGLEHVKGAYAIGVISQQDPGKIVFACQGSPLLVGLGEGENFIASDAAAIVQHTKEVVYLNDEEMGVLTPDDFQIIDLDNNEIEKESSFIEWGIEEAQKGGFEHFMKKEIFEQPAAVRNAIRGRIIKDKGLAKLGGLEEVKEELREINKIIIVACGTSYYAALIGEYMIEEYAGVPVEIEYGSEFRYRKPILDKKTAVLAISQSGETADTLAAVKEANQKGALTLGLVNVVGSTIARKTKAGVYNHAGPEIGVASTKSFVSQLAVLALLTVFLGRQREMSLVMGKRILSELENIPVLLQDLLNKDSVYQEIANKYKDYSDFLYLGRKYNFPIALEGALKLKEISYLHAEGYPAGEMKHGPIALIDKNFPTIGICPSDSVYEKMISNLEEIKTRQGKLLLVATETNKDIEKMADDIIYIPKTLEMLTPIIAVLPLHLLAYYIGILKGRDVDKPRNLAKSVTVE